MRDLIAFGLVLAACLVAGDTLEGGLAALGLIIMAAVIEAAGKRRRT